MIFGRFIFSPWLTVFPRVGAARVCWKLIAKESPRDSFILPCTEARISAALRLSAIWLT